MDLLLQCKVCGKTGELMVCTGCEEVFYCSRECQVKDWASHKLWCKTRQAQIAREKQLAQQAQQTPPSEPSPSSASQPSPRPAPADAAAAPQQSPTPQQQQQPTEAAATGAETPQPPPKPKPEPQPTAETPTPKPQTAAETPSPSPNPESAQQQQQQQSKPAQWTHSSTPALPPQPSHGPPQPGLSSPSPYAGSGDMSSGTMSSGAVEEDVDEFGDDFGDDLRTRRGWQHKMRRFVSETSTAAQRRLGSLKDSVQEMHIGEKTRRAVTNVTEAVKSAARKPGEQSASSSAGQQPPLSSSSPPSSTDSTPGLAPSSLAANATTNALLAPPGPGDTDAVFGVSFELAVRRSGHICKELPDVLVLCCSYLMRHGLEEEGLFRLSGSLREVAVLRGAFQKGDTPNMEEIGDPHVVTGLLKLWFRELPESLFERRPGAPTDPLPGGPYKTLLGQLHDGRRKAVQVLFELLSKVAANSTKNKMNPNNLAIVFSPTLQAANDIVVNLITNYSALFDQSTGPKLPPAWPNLSGAKPLPHAPVAEEAQRQQRKPLPPPPKAKPLPPLPPAQQPQPQPPQTDLLL